MPLQDTPIFVVGPPRCGTTLTASVLGSGSSVHAPGESHFFERIAGARFEGPLQDRDRLRSIVHEVHNLYGHYNYSETQDFVDQNLSEASLTEAIAERLTDVDLLQDQIGVVYATFMNQLATATAKPLFCDDTPKHLFYLEEIVRTFPNAKVIACIRDPRDFLCSYKNYAKRSTDQDRVSALYHPIVTSLLWRSSSNAIGSAMKGLPGKNLLLVRYEDLVGDPKGEFERICAFVGIPFEAGMLEVQNNNSSFEPEGRTGIFPSSVGRWTECLSDDEAWWAQKLCADAMSVHGYDRAEIARPKAGLIAIPITAVPSLLRAIRANSRTTGSLTRYVLARARALVGSRKR